MAQTAPPHFGSPVVPHPGEVNPGDEEYREKYLRLLAQTEDLEKGNDRIHVKLAKAQREIYRLKVEKGFLFQKLDELMRVGERPQQGSDDDSDAGEETKPAKKRKAPGSAASKLPPGVPPPPKKPSSAFQIYCRKLREAGQGVEKGLGPGSLGEATAIYGEKWRSLDDDDKQVYQDIYEEEKRVYERELGEYIQKYGIDPTGGKRPAAKKPKAEKYISSDDDDNPKKRKKNKSTPAKSGVVPQPSIVPSAPVLSSRDPIAQSAPQTPAGGEMDDLIDFGDEDDSEDDMTEEDSRNQDYNDMDVSLTYSPIGAGRAMLEDEEDELGDT